MLTTNQKGAIAETAVVKEATRLGVQVYRPVAEGGPCDMIFDIAGRLVRVQCKWAARVGDVLMVRCYRSRRTRDGLVSRRYDAGEVDAFAAYSFELDRCYFLPFERFAGRRSVQLRLVPSANNQRCGVNWASDFEFDATLASAGP